LLVHRTFNVSIPKHHIPSETWEFEYGPAENDPQFGQGAAEGGDGEGEGEGEQGEDAPDAEASETPEASSGKWVHRITGDKLGGDDGLLEFTVIGFVTFLPPFYTSLTTLQTP